jgi:hypothetical protein
MKQKRASDSSGTGQLHGFTRGGTGQGGGTGRRCRGSFTRVAVEAFNRGGSQGTLCSIGLVSGLAYNK